MNLAEDFVIQIRCGFKQAERVKLCQCLYFVLGGFDEVAGNQRQIVPLRLPCLRGSGNIYQCFHRFKDDGKVFRRAVCVKASVCCVVCQLVGDGYRLGLVLNVLSLV